MLASPPISNQQAERRRTELLYEFYRRYFTGQPVTVGGYSRTFPLIAANTEQVTPWLFGDATLRGQPPAWVHTLIVDWRLGEQEETATAKLVRGDVTLSVFVRVAQPGDGLQQPDFLCRTITDGLRQIFENESLALAQKDIHNVRVRRGPVPVAFPATNSRLLTVTAQTMYRTAY